VNWYWIPWKKYADFSGRASRREFWTFVLVNCLMIGLLIELSAYMKSISGSGLTGFLAEFLTLAVIVPSLAVTVRRAHDIGNSGWVLLWLLVPLIGFILPVAFCFRGDVGSNRFGPDPVPAPQELPGQLAST